MKDSKKSKGPVVLTAMVVLLVAASSYGRSHKKTSFEYVAGTESIPKGCQGKLEVTNAALVYQCAESSIAVPYHSITTMEYKPRVSKQLRKMKLNWAIKPSSSRSKHEGFFSVLYSEKGQTRAIILKVSPDTMRPYLAEIGLRTGRPIHSREN